MIRYGLLALICMTLSGCYPTKAPITLREKADNVCQYGQKLERGTAEYQQCLDNAINDYANQAEASHKQVIKELGHICVGYGFKRGTEKYSECIQKEMHMRELKTMEAKRTNEEIRRENEENLDRAVQGFADTMKRNADTLRGTHCKSNVLGNTVNTSCY